VSVCLGTITAYIKKYKEPIISKLLGVFDVSPFLVFSPVLFWNGDFLETFFDKGTPRTITLGLTVKMS